MILKIRLILASMNYLNDLKYPLLMSGLIFMLSVLNLWGIDFYAAALTFSYFVLGSISNVGGRYFELTGERIKKKALKLFVDPPGVLVLVSGLFYAMIGTFHWITTGCAAFLTLIFYAITYSDWDEERKAAKERTRPPVKTPGRKSR